MTSASNNDRHEPELADLTESAALDGSACVPMQALRPADPAGLGLARARVLGAMFGDHSAVARIGRFRVLERLGAGAMGVVHAAYDPDLDRGVALKLVAVPTTGRAAALAEAKALARLSHPNVVPIYDVGIDGDHVYLVMELVRGKTLRRWIDGRRRRAILEVYQQAGAALAAAHAAGLVHRDFKPDNAIVGADGRVRVVDFGLACEAEDPALDARLRPAAGTPRFMAPEIAAGAAVTAAADQYSFCVALSDALATVTGEPASRRITAVLERGRASDPAARFTSMTQLLRALARDPARTRRRIAALAAVAAAIGTTAFLAGQRTPHAADDPAADRLASCDTGAARLASAWSPTARASALTRIASLGAYGRSLAPQLERGLAAHENRWVTGHRGACRDRMSGVDSDTLSDRRTACLRQASDAYARLGELVAAAQPASLVDLARAAQSLPDPAVCSDGEALASDVAPPRRDLAASVAQLRTRLTRARVDLRAGRYTEARDAAKAEVSRARALGYPPVLAEALLLEGHAQSQLHATEHDRADAIPILVEATSVAIVAHLDPVAIEAWARRAWAQATSTDPDHALGGVEVIEALAERTPSARFAHALLYNNVGNVELAGDQREPARRDFQRALDKARGVTGDGALELIGIRANLGLVSDDHELGDQLLAEAEARRVELLGREHPDTLELSSMRGTITIDDLGRALAVLTPVCRGYELHAALQSTAALCWHDVEWLHRELGDDAAAIAALERARRVAPGDAALAMARLALVRGTPAAAAPQLAALLSATPETPAMPWWKRRDRAALQVELGEAQRRSGELRAARTTLRAAVAQLAEITDRHPSALDQRWLGRARVELALTLAALGATEAELAPIANAAIAWLGRVGSPSRELAALRRGKAVR